MAPKKRQYRVRVPKEPPFPSPYAVAMGNLGRKGDYDKAFLKGREHEHKLLRESPGWTVHVEDVPSDGEVKRASREAKIKYAPDELQPKKRIENVKSIFTKAGIGDQDAVVQVAHDLLVGETSLPLRVPRGDSDEALVTIRRLTKEQFDALSPLRAERKVAQAAAKAAARARPPAPLPTSPLVPPVTRSAARAAAPSTPATARGPTSLLSPAAPPSMTSPRPKRAPGLFSRIFG